MRVHILGLLTTFLIVLPINSFGQTWVARYNGPGNGRDEAYAIAVDNTGNILVTGRSLGSGTFSDFATIKYDSLGIERWVARYNGPGNDNDIARAIAIDDANNVYIAGEDRVDTNRDFVTVKYDSSGVEQWVARYNGPGNGVDGAWKVTLDEVDNVYVTGWSFDSSSDSDYATIKYNPSGVEQWVARYNGPGNNLDEPYAIAVDNGGNILVTGKSWGSGTDFDYATIKYDSLGLEQWVTRYDGPSSYWDWAWAMCVDATGNVYVTGASCAPQSFCDYATVKYNSAGVEEWVARYDGPNSEDDRASALAVDNAGNVFVTGYSTGPGTEDDYVTIKYLSTGVSEDLTSEIKNGGLVTTIISGPLHLPEGKNCRVFDITGRVATPDEIRPGIYFIEIDGEITQKVVKIK